MFAVFVTNTLPEHDNGEVFNYRRSEFADEEDFNNWIEQIRLRSVVNTDIEVSYEDEILTLSTCAYDFDDARLVVMARRVADDGYDKYTVYSSSINPNPMYPEIWYTKKGLTKPQFDISSTTSTEDTSTEEAVSEVTSGSTDSAVDSEAASDISDASSTEQGTEGQTTSDLAGTEVSSNVSSNASSVAEDGASAVSSAAVVSSAIN